MVKSAELALDILLEYGNQALPTKTILMRRYNCTFSTVSRAIKILEGRQFVINKMVVASIQINPTVGN